MCKDAVNLKTRKTSYQCIDSLATTYHLMSELQLLNLAPPGYLVVTKKSVIKK
jgi:hypothetical protein